MIEVDSVSKEYGSLTAVQDLSFSVAKGEILGFLGPNGAGKTTTMRVLTGFFPPSAGSVRVAGHDVVESPLAAKAKIGYLPEIPPVYPEMTVQAYVSFVATIKGVPAAARTESVERALERCSLLGVRDKLTSQLSKGYRQRVGLAQALVHDPEVLVLDEPTAGLDPQQITEVRDLIRSLGGSHTVILSTHILPEVSITCDRVVIINRGRIVALGTPESLTERFRQAATLEITVRGEGTRVEQVLGEIDAVLDFRAVGSAPSGERSYALDVTKEVDARPLVAERLVGAGLALVELHQPGMSLEDVYLRALASTVEENA